MELTKWWGDWQHAQHAVSFDFRARMPNGTLVREYEAFSDVALLNSCLESASSLVEIGCATGELFRYVTNKHARVQYLGVDVSRPAIERARQKYPGGKFVLVKPETHELSRSVRQNGAPDVLYSKDVLHHQAKPLDFLAELLTIPSSAVVLRCRTRDVGATEWDPELSCQYHYDGWMPYIVVNTDELIAFIKKQRPDAEILVVRNHMVLGGVHGRFLPKDCYVTTTRTAETAVGVFFKSSAPGKVRVEDRRDGEPKYSISDLLWLGATRMLKSVKRRAS